MSGVFISHSSQDKTFVAKLAIDLIVRGIPVWYDSWEMEVGDKLYDRIFDGIDETTILIVALSPNSVKSKWVGKELSAALAKEDRLGRKVIIPIKIAPCDEPLSIADRIYADFTLDYLRALEGLETVLRNAIGDLSAITFDKQVLAIAFTRGVFLDRTALQKQYDRLAPALRSGARLTAKQIVIAPDHRLEEMRNVMLRVVESYGEHKHYNPEIEKYLKETYEVVRKAEAALIDGIADIANGVFQLDASAFADASFWYSRLIRGEIVFRISALWKLGQPDQIPPFGEEAVPRAVSSNEAAAVFFGADVRLVDIYARDTNDYLKVWIGSDTEVYELPFQFRERLLDFWSYDLIYKYIVPQMVAKYRLYNPSSAKLFWDLPDKLIGPA